METTTNIPAIIQETGLTKASQDIIAQTIVQRVMDGDLNPLEAKLRLKSIEAVVEQAMKAIDAEARSEAEKHGSKTFEYNGVEIQLASFGTKYDYSGCNDSKLQELQDNLDRAKKLVDDRQAFLKAIKGSATIVNDETGEVETVYPPVKKSTDGLKIMFK